MIELEKYYPIDRNKVRSKWDEIMNIPNNQWDINNIDNEIEVINDDKYPYTLRTAKLNMLPYLIIEILNKGV